MSALRPPFEFFFLKWSSVENLWVSWKQLLAAIQTKFVPPLLQNRADPTPMKRGKGSLTSKLIPFVHCLRTLGGIDIKTCFETKFVWTENRIMQNSSTRCSEFFAEYDIYIKCALCQNHLMFTINLVTLACVDSAMCCVDSAICCVDTVTRRGGRHWQYAPSIYCHAEIYSLSTVCTRIHCILIFTYIRV